jgi:hypothetical protein
MVVGVIVAEGYSAKKGMKRWPFAADACGMKAGSKRVVLTLRLIGGPLGEARIMETTHFPTEPLFLGL